MAAITPPSVFAFTSGLVASAIGAAEVSIPTIKRLEAQDGPLGGRDETGAKICSALETAGVEFLEENGGGPGVRLRKRQVKHGKRASRSRGRRTSLAEIRGAQRAYHRRIAKQTTNCQSVTRDPCAPP